MLRKSQTDLTAQEEKYYFALLEETVLNLRAFARQTGLRLSGKTKHDLAIDIATGTKAPLKNNSSKCNNKNKRSRNNSSKRSIKNKRSRKTLSTNTDSITGTQPSYASSSKNTDGEKRQEKAEERDRQALTMVAGDGSKPKESHSSQQAMTGHLYLSEPPHPSPGSDLLYSGDTSAQKRKLSTDQACQPQTDRKRRRLESVAPETAECSDLGVGNESSLRPCLRYTLSEAFTTASYGECSVTLRPVKNWYSVSSPNPSPSRESSPASADGPQGPLPTPIFQNTDLETKRLPPIRKAISFVNWPEPMALAHSRTLEDSDGPDHVVSG